MNEVILRLAVRAAGCCMFECLCGKLGAAVRMLLGCYFCCVFECVLVRGCVYVYEVVCVCE